MFIYQGSHRLNQIQLGAGGNQCVKEVHMWSIIRKSFVYIAFLIVLFRIIYSHRDQNVSLLKNLLPNARHDQYWSSFDNDSSYDQTS